MASLKDVAKLANVSLMTVSRALNNPERLKPETLRARHAEYHWRTGAGYRHHAVFG